MAETRVNGSFIHNSELMSFGCRNCIWKQYRQCPHGLENKEDIYEFIDTQSLDSSASSEPQQVKGYCMEYISFIMSLCDEGDSASAMWEKFHLYMAELQSMDDFTELKEIEKDLQKAMDEGEKEKIDNKRHLLKMWWFRLNESVRIGRQKICDREQKARAAAGVALPGIKRQGIDFSKPKQIENKEES